MGDRVAVLKDGILQQVDTPQNLYDEPDNVFVAAFIGSPSMNLYEGTLTQTAEGASLKLGSQTIAVPASVLEHKSALKDNLGKTVTVGIRPEDMEDASLVSDAPPERRIASHVELREALGSDVVVHFKIDAPPAVTDDVRELAVDVGAEALEHVEQHAKGGKASVVARLNPRTEARKGERIDLVVDTHRLHFFDIDNGSGIYGSAVG